MGFKPGNVEGMELIRLSNFYKGKKILVTGHTGFKGSWLSIWLNYLGANVVGLALDPNNKNGIFEKAKLSSIFYDDLRLDIRDKDKLICKVNEISPDVVFHLAAQPLVLTSYSQPLETFEVNTQGTANILEAIRLTESVKKVVMITTDKVYHNQEWEWPYRESERLGGIDPYSASKAASELIISSYRESFFMKDSGLKYIATARAGNVIGGGDWSENRLIPDCINHIRNNSKILIRNPNAVRPWQHVLEPLMGYIMLGCLMGEKDEIKGGAWNFGPESSNIVEVKTLVNLLIKKFKKGEWEIRNDHTFKNLHEAKLLSLDISKVKSNIGWKPTLNLEETLNFTIDWYNSESNLLDFSVNQIKEYLELWKLRNDN